MAMRSMMRTIIKKVRTALASGSKATAEVAYKEATPVIDRMARKGFIHKNAAARYKSRLNGRIKALAA